MVQTSILLLLASQLVNAAHGSRGSSAQAPLVAPDGQHHHVDAAILSALKQFSDPVDALTFLNPEMAGKLAEPRLLRIAGEREPRMLTEGDKMRLRRNHTKFADITNFQDLYQDNISAMAGKAYLPNFTHQSLIKPLFPQISTTEMHDSLKTLSSFYTRYSHSITGEQSAVWLHDQIADIIKNAPFHTRISLSYFTHDFAQPSIIARFETKVADASLPLTIVGAHQDSMNYLFPLLPAPGADDDGSGTITILETFKVLANSGYIPERGPVEFHWYAAEEDGLLGSQAIAKFKKETNSTIGAMMEFDMTAFVARNATEEIGFIESEADPALTKWAANLAKEYSTIPANIHVLPPGAGSDYMSFTKAGFPSTFASEGNPSSGNGRRTGDYDPYVHSTRDTMYIDDETGVFSVEHMARFAELAIAFVVEQAGWNNVWR